MFGRKKIVWGGDVINFKSTFKLTYVFAGHAIVNILEAEKIFKEEHQKLLATLSENTRVRFNESGRDIASIEINYNI